MQGRKGRLCYKRPLPTGALPSSARAIRFTIEHDSERYPLSPDGDDEDGR